MPALCVLDAQDQIYRTMRWNLESIYWGSHPAMINAPVNTMSSADTCFHNGAKCKPRGDPNLLY